MIKILSGSLREYKRGSILTILLSILEAAFEILIPLRIYEGYAAGERLLAFNSPIMQFFMYACMILISWIGAKAIVASGNNAALGMTTGDLTALFSYATQILMALMMLSMVFAMIIISLASARRIAKVLEEKTDIDDPADPVMTVRDGSVCFEQVSFAYSTKSDKKVLNDINLSIASGQTVPARTAIL